MRALLLGVICIAGLLLSGPGIAGPQQGNPPAAPPQNPPAAAQPQVTQTPSVVQPPATQPPADQPQADKNPVELASHEEPAMFKTRVNLVMVPVVVRDRQGKAIGTLRQQDFTLLDRGKSQEILKFSVEKSGGKVFKNSEDGEGGKQLEQPAAADIPTRFIAYMFDDIHLAFADAARVRDAAARHMSESLTPTDRAAIFTTSGQLMLEFTDDRMKLEQTLLRLRPTPVASLPSSVAQCPDISYYMADRILKNDTMALQAAVADTIACMNLDPTQPGTTQIATSMTQGAASRELSIGQQETHVSFVVLKDAVRRMSAMPGQRTIVLVSPGFYKTDDQMPEETEILDRAIRANVIISTLDARGLWTDPTFDASRSGRTSIAKARYDRESALAQADVLAELSSGTGGTFFQNSNDLDEGFKRTAAAPEFYYLLGFSPQNLKLDGGFHALKVTAAKAITGVTVSARRGYYAPKRLEDAAATAKREIEEALFSREEMSDIPVELHTQFFKTADDNATVAVLARLDMKHIQLRKDEGRNKNVITVLAGLFDRNGNFVAGITKTVELKLKDETVVKLMGPGMSIRTNFDVKPGTYAVRLVVREAEGQLMSAQNGAIEIPQ